MDSRLIKLRILRLSEFDVSPEDKSSGLYETEFDELEIWEDKEVGLTEIRAICKMILRNFIGCQFYSKDKFFVHFGWDYYMYIGSSEKCLSGIKFAKDNGLLVEECRSPYYFAEEETTRMIQWNEIRDEIVVGDEELSGISLDEYRKIFNLSEEHPVIGSFEITEDQSCFFQRFLKHKMDFSKYEYSFWGGY
jgi:hypothetical protein